MIVNVFVANEKVRTNDLDGAIDLLRATLDDQYVSTDMLRCGATTAALVEALLRRGRPTDLREAQEAIDRLSAVPTEPGFVVYDLWLLPMRAELGRAQGNDTAYRDYRDRYRAMAKSLGFEGHMQWAESMP
jgi:adenylate cyclase